MKKSDNYFAEIAYSDANFTAKDKRLYRFLEVDENANLIVSSNSRRQR